jgi:hypothetical protein
MCIKINKTGKQEVGIWWVQKRFPRYGVPIWSLWPNIRFLCPSVLPSVQDIFLRTFLGNCWWQKFDIWSQSSYRYTMLWVVFLELRKMRRKMCIYKCMLNVYKNQQNRQTGCRNLMGPKTLPTIWGTYMKLNCLGIRMIIPPLPEGGILFDLCPSVLPSVQDIFRRIFLSNCWWQKSDIWIWYTWKVWEAKYWLLS